MRAFACRATVVGALLALCAACGSSAYEATPDVPVMAARGPLVVADDVALAAAQAVPAVEPASPSTTTTTAPASEPPPVANEMVLAPTTTAAPFVAPAAVAPRAAVAAASPAPQAPPATFAPAAAIRPLNTGAAADFLSRTNAVRASVGLAPLVRNGALEAYAASWVRELESRSALSHSSNPDRAIAAGWHIAGENVGVGGSVASVHDKLVASPSHYQNLVTSQFTSMGVAVVVGDDGRLWVCEVFGG